MSSLDKHALTMIVSGRCTRDDGAMTMVGMAGKDPICGGTAASPEPSEPAAGSVSLFTFVTNGVTHDVETWFRVAGRDRREADVEGGWTVIHVMGGTEVAQRVIT